MHVSGYKKVLILLGLIVALVPVLGFSQEWENTFLVIAGILIVILALLESQWGSTEVIEDMVDTHFVADDEKEEVSIVEPEKEDEVLEEEPRDEVEEVDVLDEAEEKEVKISFVPEDRDEEVEGDEVDKWKWEGGENKKVQSS